MKRLFGIKMKRSISGPSDVPMSEISKELKQKIALDLLDTLIDNDFIEANITEYCDNDHIEMRYKLRLEVFAEETESNKDFKDGMPC